MKHKLSKDSRILLIKRSLQGEAVNKLCKESGISRQLFYRWLKKYKQNGEDALTPAKSGRPKEVVEDVVHKTKYTSLSPKARSLMVKEVLEHGAGPAEVAKRYGISRITLYKWLKRYKSSATQSDKDNAFVSRVPHIEHYFKQTPEKYEQSILSLIAKHPEYGIRSLVKNLPKIGSLPIVGHHGVQNVLRRNNLSTFALRSAYAKSLNTGLVVTITNILAPAVSFFKLGFNLRSKLVKLSGSATLTAFSLIVVLGLVALFANNVVFASGGSKFGLTLALISLAMGSIFFLYSLKYYITLAIVLSFSQDSDSKKRLSKPEGGLLAWILGMSKPGIKQIDNSLSAVGLESDLSGVKLKRLPFISVQIPFFNEKNVVERAIRASTGFKYAGEYEVVLCDDSTDETTEIIRRYQEDCLFKYEKLKETRGDGWIMTEVEIKPGLTLKHIHRTSRDGYKGQALNLALKLANPKTEYVAVFDADFVPYPDSLELFLKYFQVADNQVTEGQSYKDKGNSVTMSLNNSVSSHVAAVQGYQWHVLNKSENWITRGVRSEYAGSYVIERSGAEIYGGLKQISGSVYMIKRDVLAEIGWGTSITEDFELTLRLYEKGYKVLYTPYIQAPAECVSTVKRLVRQRMRWAEGHSFNIKKMFKRLIFNPNLSFAEKAELVYLGPYYLQAFFFLVGTVAWLLSETVFRVQLPFWSEMWGWSLVLTNMIALPLLNMVGLFVEESEQRDYLGILSFLALSYLLVPFQAYAAVKGLMETDEGPWFRTPKTGRITDIFSRGKFYKFIANILPGSVKSQEVVVPPSPYLSLSTANNMFNTFRINSTGSSWVGNLVVALVILASVTLFSGSQNIQVASLSDYPIVAKVELETQQKPFIETLVKVFRPGIVHAGSSINTIIGYNGQVTDLAKISLAGLTIMFAGLVILYLNDKGRRKFAYKFAKILIVFLMITSIVMGDLMSVFVTEKKDSVKNPYFAPKEALATYQFSPTSQTIAMGDEVTANSGAAVSAEGLSTGSWKGALASDNAHWQVTSTTSGIDAQLNFDGVQLNGGNKMIIQTEFDTDATAPSLKFQICDWSSGTSVDTNEDAYCNDGVDDDSGAGWRSINTQDASNNDINFTAASTNDVGLQWHLYNGYFTTGTTGGSPIATPLSNFIRGSDGRVKIRYYSATNTTSVLSIDFIRITTFVDSVYHPANFTNDGTGTPAGTYANTQVVGNTASAQQATATGDTIHLAVPGTAGSVSAFHLDFNGVETYSGANTIYVKAEYLCSTTNAALEHRPRIWNYTLASGAGDWENLTDTDIDCSTTAATRGWAKNNITISDYVQSNQIRIGWVGMDNGTHSISLDYIYVMIGSTNTDSSLCEVSFGSGTATNCTSTRDLDGTGTTTLFDNTAEDESATMGTGEANSHYGMDNESTSDTTVEEATSSNISFPITPPSNASVTALHFSGKFAAGTNGTNPDMTVQMGLRDYSGLNQATGGWTQIGATSANNTQVYTDSITALAIGTYGLMANPEDYVDTFNNRANIRLRTTAAGLSSRNSVTQWDFAFVSISWIADSSHPTKRYQYNMSSQNLVTGTDQEATSIVAAAVEGVNKGSWKGMLADDNLHWSVGSTTGGYDVQLNFEGVELRGANKLIVATEIDQDATAPSTKVQICDWVSTTNVDDAADITYCTGGGWRTLNTQNASNVDVNYTDTAGDALQWHLYDGYFTTGTTGGSPISTPLTNFINTAGGNMVKIRYYSTTNTTSVVSFDFLRLTAIVDSVYHPANFTNDGSGTVTGTYQSAQIVGNSATGQQSVTAGDTIPILVAGTAGSPFALHFDFNNVKTYTGANAIYVKAEYLCSTTNAALEHRPRIWNYSLLSGAGDWENLTDTDIDCSTTAATNAWAKNNITMTDYVQNGQIRVGWAGMDNGTHSISLDFIYVMIGSVNADSSLCEVTFGTGTATNCTNSRDLDVTGTTNDFTNASEDESTTMGTGDSNAFYAFDNETTVDATIEESTSSNISFPVTVPTNTSVTGLHFSGRFIGGTNQTTDLTVQMGFKDYSGFNQATGGWTQAGGTATFARAYTDSITALAIGTYGLWLNPEDHVDMYNNRVNLKLRSTAAGTAAANATTNWDFAFVSISWVESVETYAQSAYRFYSNADSTDVGSALANQDTLAVAPAQGTNFRLRMLLHLSTGELASSGQSFKLQVAPRGVDNVCDTSFTNETYADLTPSTGSIRFGTNSPSDGVVLTSNNDDPTHTTHQVRNQTYEEDNNFTNSQSRVFSGEDAKYDFVLVDFSAATDTTYCLRAVKSDGTTLSTYSVIPEFTTIPESTILLLAFLPFMFGFVSYKKKRNHK